MRTPSGLSVPMQRWRAAIAVILMSAAATLVAVTVAESAQAICVARGVRATVVQIEQGFVRAREDTRTGNASTCDGDSTYLGRVMDARDGDGRCAYVIWHDPSAAVVGQQCTYNVWQNYTAWDQQGNSSAQFDLCGSWNCSTVGGYLKDPVRGY